MQTGVTVRTDTTVVFIVKPYKKLYDTQTCLVGNGAAETERDKTSRILVENFSDTYKRLLTGKAIARAVPRPSNITEATISQGELLGLVDDNTAQLYCKRVINARDTSIVNEYLRDKRNSHMAADEKPVTAEDIDLNDMDKKLHKSIQTMLRRHEKIWDGSLGGITVTEHQIELNPEARPVKAHPYQSGPKPCELERFDIEKQLANDVIEPAILEWESPVLFVQKKDPTLRFS